MTVEPETTATRSAPQATGQRHLAYIDGIRGASACYVVLFHIYQFSSSRFVGSPPSWWKLFAVFGFGDCGVAVFIVVSGYCLMLPVVATDRMQLRGGWRRFAERRIRRLGPGYAAALVSSLLLISVVPSLRHHSGTAWDAALPAFSVGTIAAHLLLVYNWRLSWRYGIDTPMWTVALEVQIYAVFVVALLPLWRRTIGHRPNLCVLVVSMIIAGVLMDAGFAWAQPWMLVLFAFGMCAAEAASRTTRFFSGRIDRVVVLALAVVPITFVLARKRYFSYDGVSFVREVIVGIATAVLLLALRKATPANGWFTLWIGNVFSIRPLKWLGQISYSLYLVHFPIIGLVALTWVYGRGFDQPENFAVIVLVGGTVSVLVATGFHSLFERQYLSRRKVAPVV